MPRKQELTDGFRAMLSFALSAKPLESPELNFHACISFLMKAGETLTAIAKNCAGGRRRPCIFALISAHFGDVVDGSLVWLFYDNTILPY